MRLNSKRVCILSTGHPVFDPRIFHKEAKTLARAGYDVTLIAQHEKDEVVDGVKIIALPKPKNRFGRMAGLTWRAFRIALRQRADVYHFHEPELLPVGVLLKLLAKAKIIYDVHENVPKQILNKEWLPLWTRKPVSVVYEIVERVCLPFIDIIVIAEDSYIENYRGRENVIAIHNYPTSSFLTKIAHTDKSSGEDSVRDFRVTYVGGITKLRGALELIEALRVLKEAGYQTVVLQLIGPLFPRTLERELNNLVQQYGLGENVRIPGPVPHEQVASILARSNIGVAILHPDPNYVNSLPTKLFEYMAAGLPVVASNFPLWKEIVEGNRCGLCVDPLDPKAIAQAIQYLLEHPDEARRMGENGRRAVEEKYNWEHEAKKLLKLYEELLPG